MNLIDTYAAIESSPLESVLRLANAPTLPASEEATFGLLLTRRQAEALAAVLAHVSDKGEGVQLDEVYTTLVEEGCETDAVWSGVEGDLLVVTR